MGIPYRLHLLPHQHITTSNNNDDNSSSHNQHSNNNDNGGWSTCCKAGLRTEAASAKCLLSPPPFPPITSCFDCTYRKNRHSSYCNEFITYAVTFNFIADMCLFIEQFIFSRTFYERLIMIDTSKSRILFVISCILRITVVRY